MYESAGNDIKKEYDDSEVYITPTMAEVDALMGMGDDRPDIIAIDATKRNRPGNITLDEFIKQVQMKVKNL